MTPRQAKARAVLMRRVLALHKPVERLARRVVYAEPKRGRGVRGMLLELRRLEWNLLEAKWAVKDWRRS